MDKADRFILVDFELDIYNEFVAQGMQPEFFYLRNYARYKKKVNKDQRIMDFDVMRWAKFEWPAREEYLNNVEYQNLIQKVFKLLIEDGLYSRFYIRDKGERFSVIPRWGWVDMYNHIYKSLYYYLDIIVKYKITSIICSKIPHEGSLVILFLLAKEMGLECIACHQSQFSNCFWITKNASFGTFFERQNMLTTKQEKTLVIPEVKSPHYMKTVVNRKTIFNLRVRNISKTILRTLALVWIFNPDKYKKTFHGLYRSFQRLPLTRDYSKTVRFKSEGEYVYFPLHLQPEMTTDSLGMQYADQINAVEKLRSMIPKEWIIYCKENPKQNLFMREDDFYYRLATIPNVQIVDVHSNTFDLIKYSKFIATITGTAGWEALRMGKKVLLFGDVWYQDLSGVYKVRDIVSIDEMELSSSIERKSLEQGFSALTKYLHKGVINSAYKAMVEEYDDAENAKCVVSSICEAVNGGLDKKVEISL
ncbi:MAG: hypothetical protein M9899_05915 [Bdellovibrionaceae bacterium]|nr:hypothetical protein [Pseudobdellovibrionaceae bacterium]